MSSDERREQKSNLWKWLLGCGCLVVLIGAVGIGIVVWQISKSFTTDPVKAKAIANSFLQFDLPDGYQMKFAMKLMGVKMAVFMHKEKQESGMMGWMMFFPKSLGQDRATMKAKMEEQMQKQGNRRGGKVESTETEILTVRGEEVEATRSVVSGESGKNMIQYSFFLTATDGTVMIMAMGPEEGFDENAFHDFVDSIK
ncbi:MAG: hypothetical protein ACYTHM_13365 [Planctomycetota bacterium]|jgi:hypothetical protein